MESVSCNLQTGSHFPKLASTCYCKIGGKSGQKLHSVFQALVEVGDLVNGNYIYHYIVIFSLNKALVISNF